MVITITAAYQLAKKKRQIDGVIHLLLLLGLGAFWVVLSYSLYFLVAYSMQFFDQPKAPYFVRILWPSALLPYAPLFFALFAWWHSFMLAIYWFTADDVPEKEQRGFREWHQKRLRRSLFWWSAIYLLILIAIQIWYRLPFFSTIALPSPLP